MKGRKVATKQPKSKKRKRTLAQGNAIAGYLFIAPFILGFILFMAVPLFQSLLMSFNEVTPGIGGFEMEFVGIKNFKDAFTVDAEFVPYLTTELLRMLTNLPATLIFSFFIALLLNQSFKGRGLVRAIFFLPVIVSSGVLVGLEYSNDLLSGIQDMIKETSNSASITGVLEDILVTDNAVSSTLFGYIFDIINSVYDIAIASGIQIIVFLSGLQTISPSMFEAAKIEGCTAWECFWKITLPMVSSLILVNIVYTVIDFFVKTDNQVMTKISDTVAKMEYGFSSAMAWVYFLCVLAILGIVSLLISRRVYYYE